MYFLLVETYMENIKIKYIDIQERSIFRWNTNNFIITVMVLKIQKNILRNEPIRKDLMARTPFV
jgi:hypothetical protein